MPPLHTANQGLIERINNLHRLYHSLTNKVSVVQGFIDAGETTASNALTKTAGDIKLGGSMIQNTQIIQPETFDLRFTNAADTFKFTISQENVYTLPSGYSVEGSMISFDNTVDGVAGFIGMTNDSTFNIEANNAGLNLYTPYYLAAIAGLGVNFTSANDSITFSHSGTATKKINFNGSGANTVVNFNGSGGNGNSQGVGFTVNKAGAQQNYIFPLAQPTAVSSVMVSTAAGQWSWLAIKGSFTNDTTASAGGVPLGGIYYNTTNSILQARLT